MTQRILLGDVGGTNARFAVLTDGAAVEHRETRVGAADIGEEHAPAHALLPAALIRLRYHSKDAFGTRFCVG